MWPIWNETTFPFKRHVRSNFDFFLRLKYRSSWCESAFYLSSMTCTWMIMSNAIACTLSTFRITDLCLDNLNHYLFKHAVISWRLLNMQEGLNYSLSARESLLLTISSTCATCQIKMYFRGPIIQFLVHEVTYSVFTGRFSNKLCTKT